MPGKRTGRQYKDLKNSVKALFDEAGNAVKEAPEPSTKRRRRQSARQMDWRLEEPFAAILSQRAQDVLKREKERTGEGLAAILERAILNLESPDKGNAGAFPNNETRPSSPIGTEGDDYRSQILNRVVTMKDNENLSFEEIAGRFNSQGIKTFSGKGRWHGITISAMYERFRQK